MAIIITKNGKEAKKIDKSDFEKENYLQNLIHESPESIPVYEIAEDKNNIHQFTFKSISCMIFLFSGVQFGTTKNIVPYGEIT